MKVIAVGTLKGGTGKTTMTFNLAGVLAENSKVLLIDMDPQCNLSNNTGVVVTDENAYTVIDVFEPPIQAPDNLVVEHPIPMLPNMDIIPSSIYLVATEIKISSKAARERILANYIEDHMDFFGRYDYILIDTNPSMNIINQNAFLAADSIILVADADDNSRLGVHAFTYLWGEIRRDLRKEDNVKALIVNRADVRTTLTKDIFDYYSNDEELSEILVPQMVRPKVAYAKAALEKVPVNIYKDGADATIEIQSVVNILTERGVF